MAAAVERGEEVAVRDAWFEYLSMTQGRPEPSYSEVEPWAWGRLQSKLRAVAQRVAARGRGLA